MLSGLFVKSAYDLSKPANSESGDSWFGLGPPLVIGLGLLLVGVVLMIVWRFRGPGEAVLRPPTRDGRLSHARRRPRHRLRRHGGRPRGAVPRDWRSPASSARPIALVFSYEKVVVGGEAHDLDAAVAERSAQVLAEGAALVEAAGVAVTTEAREGTPADVLAEVAAERDARMLVIGSYGEAPLRALIVGSTTQRLLRTTDRPVLVVRTRR